ncbi:cytochrome b [Aestuariibacter halophilus]|uniref:Cytochrome b n=1 Tax=Fluctibacter halophilus TaxID=226011 RepID=A0ABS8G981_9ALTE|nr:cytochrome b [Aestuariibacter halophilus]MCC2617090.1 cytochrome b [Aestuariibacter halophilus]
MKNGYSFSQRLVHWLTLLVIIVVYLAIENRGLFERGSDERALVMLTHFYAGFTILILAIIRLVLRMTNSVAPIDPLPPVWLQRSAMLGHVLLYAFLLAMPIIGLVMLNAKGGSLDLFGVSLPSLWPKDPEMAEQLEELHESIGKFGYVLIGLHAVVALVHHHVLKDNTLTRMTRGR